MAELPTAEGTPAKVCFLLITVIFAAGLLLFLISGTVTVFNIGHLTGCLICLSVCLMCIFRKKAAALIIKMSGNIAGRAVLTGILTLIIIGIIAAAVISVLMIQAAHRPPDDESLCVIVLGCRVKDTGPSLMLQQRIDAAYDYLTEHPAAICIASGGKGNDEPVSEAEAISSALVSRGISADRIISESGSVNTFENIRNSFELLDDLGLPRQAVIVTSEFHQLRAKMLCEKQGGKVWSISCRTNPFLLPAYWIREWIGVMHELIIGRK